MKVCLVTEFWVQARKLVRVDTQDVEIFNGRFSLKPSSADKVIKEHDGVHDNFLEVLSEAPCLNGWEFSVDVIGEGWDIGEEIILEENWEILSND